MNKWTPVDVEESGKAIRWFREKQGWTQEQIADALAVSRTAVFKWENGRSLPTLDNVMRLSNLLRVYVEDIIIMADDKEESNDDQLTQEG